MITPMTKPSKLEHEGDLGREARVLVERERLVLEDEANVVAVRLCDDVERGHADQGQLLGQGYALGQGQADAQAGV